jgi:hypothetical protein
MGKAGRKLTRLEKEYVLGNGKNPKEYIFLYDINDSYFKIKNKETGIECTCDKYRRAKNKWDY